MNTVRSKVTKNKQNLRNLATYLYELGCLGKGESIKLNEKGWSNQKITCPSPKHPDNNPSANLNSKSETIYCHVCKKTWNLEEALKLYRKKIELTADTSNFKKNKKTEKPRIQKAKTPKIIDQKKTKLVKPGLYPCIYKSDIKKLKIVDVYPYRGPDGLISYYRLRLDPKNFKSARIEYFYAKHGIHELFDSELIWNLKRINKWYPLYLGAIKKSKTVIITEGEKDSKNLFRFIATNRIKDICTTTFIKTNDECLNESCKYLKDKEVYLCADIDGPEKNFKGEKTMFQKIGPIVSKIAKSTKVLELQLKPGEDVSDLIGSNPDKLLRIIKDKDSLPEWNINYFINESEVPKEVLEINKKHAVVRSAPKTAILYENDTGDNDDRSFILYDINGIKQFYRNQQIPNPQAEIDGRCKAFINPLDYWLDWTHRRTFTKIVFEPSGRVKPFEYNTWQGFIPSKGANNCELILKHIFEIVVNENQNHFDWLMDWFADIIQNPSAEPRGTAIVLKGGRGSGKSIIGEYIGKIFGPHYQLIDTPEHIFGKFNYHLTQKLFVQIEEAVWGGDKTREGKLKSLITSKFMPVEKKFGDIFSARNYLRIMITSNEDWVVPAPPGSRRFFVLKTNDKYLKGNDKSHNEKCRKYFDALVNEMKNGGPEALLLYLKDRKIESDLRYAPHTEGLVEQRILTMDIVHRWLYSRIAEDERLIDRSKKWGGRLDKDWEHELQNDTEFIINKLQKKWTSDWVPYEIIYYDFNNFEKNAGKGRYGTSKKAFSQKLKEILGIDGAKQRTILIDDDHPNFSRKRRIMCIKFPTLKECKGIFYEKTGIKAEL